MQKENKQKKYKPKQVSGENIAKGKCGVTKMWHSFC